MRTLIARIRRRLADEAGVALVAGVGITCVLGIAGTTVMEYTSSNVRNAARSQADQTAYTLAEGGINSAASVLSAASDPTQANLLPARTTTDTTGSVTWWGTFDSGTSAWTVYSKASVPAPAPNPPVTRLISARIRVGAGFTAPQPNRSWDYLYATRSGFTCDENVASSVTVGCRSTRTARSASRPAASSQVRSPSGRR